MGKRHKIKGLKRIILEVTLRGSKNVNADNVMQVDEMRNTDE
jgi:hypothetical protein